MPQVWEGSFIQRALGKLNLEWIPSALITPDERVFWADKASRKARTLIRAGGYDIIYTTGPPHSILLAGLWLKRELKKIPWIAEFRDPWTLAPFLTSSNPHQQRFARETESDLMERADAVIMVTPSFARMMREKYPQSASKVHCVENGFDREDFAKPQDIPRNQEFTIVAAGTVFGRYNMNDFLDALEKLRDSDRDIYQRLRVSFQGLPDYKLNQRLLMSGLNDRCRSRGFVPHHENIGDIRSADLLVLPLSPVEHCEGHVPSRVYEFLASGSPTLAICPDGDLASLLGGFPGVVRRYPGDIDGIIDALKNAVSEWESGERPPAPPESALRPHTREEKARELDRVMLDLLAHQQGGGK
jgi:glycosyltransferase involved in cell wall biosynthesis